MKSLIAIVITSTFFFSCKKDEVKAPDLANINVVNAAVNAGTVKVNNFGVPVIWATYSGANATVNFSAFKNYTVNAGNAPITIVPTSDTLTPIYNNSIATTGGDVYSLYLAGQNPTYEAILVKETIPAIAYTDSSVNVRVINLVANSTPINVTLSTTTTVNEFADLAYKQSSPFKNYAAKVANGANYAFQIRKASDNSVLATGTVTLASTRFHSVTLVFKGLIGGTGTNVPGVLQVNNF
jgi:hypothetical protein